jgi:uncharacterized membrane protein (Fun14 family)
MEEKLQGLNLELPYLEMGSGFLIGLSVGYFLKKSFKLILLLMGLVVVAMFVLESKGVITINESSLDQTVSAGANTFKVIANFLKESLGALTFAGGGSAIAGFLTGLKWG